MNNQEAIKIVDGCRTCNEYCESKCDDCSKCDEAIGMAIKALEEQEKYQCILAEKYGSDISLSQFLDIFFKEFDTTIEGKKRKTRILSDEDADLYDEWKASRLNAYTRTI